MRSFYARRNKIHPEVQLVKQPSLINTTSHSHVYSTKSRKLREKRIKRLENIDCGITFAQCFNDKDLELQFAAWNHGDGIRAKVTFFFAFLFLLIEGVRHLSNVNNDTLCIAICITELMGSFLGIVFMILLFIPFKVTTHEHIINTGIFCICVVMLITEVNWLITDY